MTAVPSVILRDYQIETVEAIDRELEERASTLVVMATGTGKTTVFAESIRRRMERSLCRRALVLAHRVELLEQAAKRIERQTGISCDIEMGEYRAGFGWACAPVVCGSIQTLASRDMKRASRFSFDYIIVDEAHHAVAASYRRVIDHYMTTHPGCRLLGVTATPDRGDEAALGEMFDSVAYEMTTLDAIEAGWLVRVSQRFVQCRNLDLSGVHTQAGDLNQRELSDVLNQESVVYEMVVPMLDIVGDRRTIIFAANVKQANQVAQVINARRSQSCAVVTGETPSEERRSIFDRFGRGHHQFLANCMVATEGWDDPATDGRGVQVVAIMRPTKSRALYAQMAGRGTRPLPGVIDGLDTAESRRDAIARSAKPNVLLLDFVGNAGRHQLIHGPDILGGESSDAIAKAKAAMKRGELDIVEAVAKAKEEIEEERREAEKRRAARAKKEQEEEERKAERLKGVRSAAKAEFVSTEIDPFRFVGITPRRIAEKYKGREASDAQKKFIASYRVPVPPNLNFQHARQLLGELTKKPTPGQCWILKKHGLDPDRFSFQSAKVAIEQAKQGAQ